MANSYTQVLIQYVFTVKGRDFFIPEKYFPDLNSYIAGIIKKRKGKSLAISNVPDHMHVFMQFPKEYTISKMIQEIKANSSKYINDNQWFKAKFQWQSGYGAFSYSYSQMNNVIQYILNQKEHHRHVSFKEEYFQYLKLFNIEYDDHYVFEFYE